MARSRSICYGVGMDTPTCRIVGFDEQRDVDRITDAQGNVIELKVRENSERAKICLQLPSGVQLWVGVPYKDYVDHVVPAFDAVKLS